MKVILCLACLNILGCSAQEWKKQDGYPLHSGYYWRDNYRHDYSNAPPVMEFSSTNNR
jgi:hypothetical protein